MGAMDNNEAPPPRPTVVLDKSLLSEQAKHTWGLVPADVLAIAVLVQNSVVDYKTGKSHDPERKGEMAAAAIDAAFVNAEDEAADESASSDRRYRALAAQANASADAAVGATLEADKVLEQEVMTSVGTPTRRMVAKDHAEHLELAKLRADAGDTRHTQDSLGRWVILTCAIVYGLLDLILLFRPLLNLGTISEAGDLANWLIAIVLSGAMAVALDQVLKYHQTTERAATDRRDALLDHNRRVRLASATTEAPDLQEVAAADRRLLVMQYLLVGQAIITAILAAVRITFLARDEGRSIVESTLFGAAVGLVLGILIIVLGRTLCRGNQLGDQLDAEGEIVDETRELRDNGVKEARRLRDEARDHLDEAKAARAESWGIRQTVYAKYLKGVKQASVWLDVDRPDTDVTARQASVIILGDELAEAADEKIKRVRLWLGESPTPPDELLAIKAGSSALVTDDEPEPGAVLAKPRQVHRTTLPNAGRVVVVDPDRVPEPESVDVPEAPTEPKWFVALGAALTVATALLAAYFHNPIV